MSVETIDLTPPSPPGSVGGIDLTPAATPASVGKVDLTPAASAGSPGTIDESSIDFTDDADAAVIIKIPAGSTIPLTMRTYGMSQGAAPVELSGDLSRMNQDDGLLSIPANSDLAAVTSFGAATNIIIRTDTANETTATWDVHTDGSMAEHLIRLLEDRTLGTGSVLVTTAAIKTALEASNASLTPTMTARNWSWNAS